MEQNFNSFTMNANVKTTVYMSVEDAGEEIEEGTDGFVFSEPSDEEELVGVIMNGSYHYFPQDVLEVQLIGARRATPEPRSPQN